MPARGPSIDLVDFSGGRNSFDPEYLVAPNQAVDLQNVNLSDRGFMKRRGNTAFNSSAMVGGSTAITGLHYMQFNSGTEFLNAVAGTKFFTSSSLTGTMADATGAVTITAGQDNIWTGVSYNNLQIWFGGGPDAPFKYSGTGNAAALGGTPPSSRTAFVANNRIFAISTSANPSRIQWPVLGDPEDWTGTGSGNQDVKKNDGEQLLFGVPLSSDIAILFKNSSTHLMTLTKSPFSFYQLQNGVGAAGRYSWVFVDGAIYFITPSRRMKATFDGKTFTDFPSHVDDLWDTVNTSRISNIYGVYYPSLFQIHWYVSTGASTTNNAAIIWDVKRKAWLYHPTGFKANVAGLVQNRRLFTGHYNGKLFEQDKVATYTDASESSPSAIDAYWQTPWLNAGALSKTIHPVYVDVACLSETDSNLTVGHGFDFATDQKTTSVSLVSGQAQWDVAEWDVAQWGGQSSIIRRVAVVGRGNNFSLRFRNPSASEAFTVQGVSIQLRGDQHRKLINVR